MNDDLGSPALRLDRTTLDWVIFAPARARRPHEFRRPAREQPEEESEPRLCPFCPGNEHLTPPEVYAVRAGTAANAPGWQVRVVPNQFPALRIEESPQHVADNRVFRHMGGCGAHEVIIESPDHDTSLADQPVEQIDWVLRSLQVRFQDLMHDTRFQTILMFKNQGERAGTSLRHPHWQLVASPIVPRRLRLKYEVATEYFDIEGECLYCVLLQEELELKERIVAANEQFVAFVPYAASRPFETWILPRFHQPSFGHIDPATFRPLAELLKKTLLALHNSLEIPDYNLVVQSCARGDEDKSYFLWHIEILPRLTTAAGLELGSGMFINPVRPEEAAEFLRSAVPSSVPASEST